MNYDNENMDFDSVSFDEDTEGVELNLTDDGDIVLDMSELNDENDIPVSVNISPKSTEKVAEDVEEVILNLLEAGDRDTLLLLTGERPDLSSNLDNNLQQDFASMYSQAVLFNPAIKWYSRLSNILPTDQFFVQNGQLHIHMPKTTFKKVIQPFLIDFDCKFYENSPIVKLVLDCAERIAQSYIENTHNLNLPPVKKRDEEGLDVSKSGLELFFDTDEVEHAGSANMRVDDNDSLNQSGIREVQSSLNFADLSNKAIASYMAENGFSSEQVADKLNQHISDKARRNEIEVLVNMAKKMHNSPLQHLRPSTARKNPNKDDFKWDQDD
jgi:hypothetical protein